MSRKPYGLHWECTHCAKTNVVKDTSFKTSTKRTMYRCGHCLVVLPHHSVRRYRVDKP